MSESRDRDRRRGFYGKILDEAFAGADAEAADSDVTQLTRRLQEAIARQPADLRRLTLNASALARAAAARDRLDPARERKAFEELIAISNDIGRQLGFEPGSDVQRPDWKPGE